MIAPTGHQEQNSELPDVPSWRRAASCRLPPFSVRTATLQHSPKLAKTNEPAPTWFHA
jgi:hypothetical protein